MRVEICNVPDSVTFITDPPTTIHVTVRDRGTRLASRWFTGSPVLRLDFKSFGNDGTFRLRAADLRTQLQSMFGTSAQLLIVSPDSISTGYTTSAGKEVPVVIVADITPQSGKTVGGAITATPAKVRVYSTSAAMLDTLTCVYTYPIARRDVSVPFTIDATIMPIKGCRVEPSTVKIKVPVEPLENRSLIVPVTTIHVPVSETLEVYPNTVKIDFLVPMSFPEISKDEFSVVVDYADIERTPGRNLPLNVNSFPSRVENATIEIDSVEYMVIRRGNGESLAE